MSEGPPDVPAAGASVAVATSSGSTKRVVATTTGFAGVAIEKGSQLSPPPKIPPPQVVRRESVHRTNEGEEAMAKSNMPADRLKFHHPVVLDNQKSMEDKNQAIFDRFVSWLLKNNAKFPHLYFKCYSSDQRGVHCKEDIERNKRIMYIPQKCLITDEIARRTKTGGLLLTVEKRLSAPNHNQIIVFMLQDMMKPTSFFKPYYDILPQDVSNFPVFWEEDELKHLEGSTLPTECKQRIAKIRNDYNIIGEVVPNFLRDFSFKKFLWCRTIVGSRNFTITIGSGKRTSMVPQADMLNHYRPRETSWTYENDIDCFTITSLKPLKKGQQVMDSYGKKCNSKFLLHYGFAVECNREANGVCLNKITVQLDIKASDPLMRQKLPMIARAKKFRVCMSYQAKETREALDYARVAVANEDELRSMTKPYATRCHTGVVSLRNEVAAIELMATSMERRLKDYPQTLAEDQALMASGKLTPFSNRRNALIVMMGEKEICAMWMAVYKEIQPLITVGSPMDRAKKISTVYSGRSDDVARCILHLNRALVLRGC